MHTKRWGGPGEDYRLSKISAVDLDQVNGVHAPTPDDAAPLWQPPKPSRAIPWLEIVMGVLGVLGLIGLVIFMLNPSSSGVFALLETTLMALISLVIVIVFLLYIDRWEPEPWKTKGVLLLWGAGVATLSSGIINTALNENIVYSLGDAGRGTFFGTTFVAPLVEETLKGLGVLVVVIVRRTSINSLLDGIVYAGFSAAGFLAAEDIVYYLRFEQHGTQALLTLFVLRGFLSPFLHVMATSMTGIGLALALIRFKRAWSRIGIVLVMWGAAMLIHGTWNGAATIIAGTGFFLFYVAVAVPAFGVWCFFLLRAARSEADAIRRGLVPYVRTGWILPGEVTMATDRRSRRAALKWSKQGGRPARRAMRSFLSSLASLGLDQRIMTKSGPDPARIDNDRQLLADAVKNRREFLRLTSIASQQRDVSKAVSARTQTA